MAYERRAPTKAQLDFLRVLLAKSDRDSDWYNMERIGEMTRGQVQGMIDRLIAETGGVENETETRGSGNAVIEKDISEI